LILAETHGKASVNHKKLTRDSAKSPVILRLHHKNCEIPLRKSVRHISNSVNPETFNCTLVTVYARLDNP
jgi:hypothetical protein